MTNSIGTAIYEQLGKGRFVAMTGAFHLVRLDNGLQFSFKGCKDANKCRITLTPRDTYLVEFFKFSPRLGDAALVKEFEDVYADTLQTVFTHYTGLDTKI